MRSVCELVEQSNSSQSVRAEQRFQVPHQGLRAAGDVQDVVVARHQGQSQRVQAAPGRVHEHRPEPKCVQRDPLNRRRHRRHSIVDHDSLDVFISGRLHVVLSENWCSGRGLWALSSSADRLVAPSRTVPQRRLVFLFTARGHVCRNHLTNILRARFLHCGTCFSTACRRRRCVQRVLLRAQHLIRKLGRIADQHVRGGDTIQLEVLLRGGAQVGVDLHSQDAAEVGSQRARVVAVATVHLQQVHRLPRVLLLVLLHDHRGDAAKPVQRLAAHGAVGVAKPLLHLLVHQTAAVRQVQCFVNIVAAHDDLHAFPTPNQTEFLNIRDILRFKFYE
eukprot:Colp12_sorted_trinity150504_noHs@33117